MKYIKCIFLILVCGFICIYTERLIKYSVSNNTILDEIDNYASRVDRNCIEGSINENLFVERKWASGSDSERCAAGFRQPIPARYFVPTGNQSKARSG